MPRKIEIVFAEFMKDLAKAINQTPGMSFTIGKFVDFTLVEEIRNLMGEKATPSTAEMVCFFGQYLLTSEESRMVADFHRQRRMFYVNTDRIMPTVEFALVGASYGHAEWFKLLGRETKFEQDVRGYYDETGIYFYRGSNFCADSWVVDVATNEEVKRVFTMDVGLKRGTQAYAGVKKMLPGERWPGLFKLYTLT